MKESPHVTPSESSALPIQPGGNPVPGRDGNDDLFEKFLQGVHPALETYSNVHRGSGHHSIITTHLFEEARKIVLGYLGLKSRRYVVVFCTPHRADRLISQLEPGSYQLVSSKDIGLSMGLRALAVRRNAFNRGMIFQSGGGTARLVSKDRVAWAKLPDRLEAGTPAIVSIIAFARALQLLRQSGITGFQDLSPEIHSVDGILNHDEMEEKAGKDLLRELQKTLIGRNLTVPTGEGERAFINLDNAASTPTFGPIWNAASRTLRLPDPARQAVINEVKSICAAVTGASPGDYEIIFTSNTTDGINLVAESLGRDPSTDIEPVVLNTMLEHNSNDLPWRMTPGLSLARLPIDANGFVDHGRLEQVLSEYNRDFIHGNKRILLVALSGASNVLGVCNDLAGISRIVHNHGARLLVDAAQLIAHRKVDVQGSDIDYLAFSAHKVYAPFGSGVLVARKGLTGFTDAELDSIRKSGEENAWGIAGLGKALVLLQRIGMDVVQSEEQALTARLLNGMKQIPGLRIYGVNDPGSHEFARKGGVVVFSLKGIMADRVANELAARAGIGVRFGCHCAHILIKHLLDIGPNLERFQFLVVTLFPRIQLPGLTRVSLGLENSEQDIDEFIRVLGQIAGRRPAPGKNPGQAIRSVTMNVSKTVYYQ